MIDQLVVNDGSHVSVLTGELVDQTALASVLQSLYELHVTLLAVEQLSADSRSDAGSGVNAYPEA